MPRQRAFPFLAKRLPERRARKQAPTRVRLAYRCLGIKRPLAAIRRLTRGAFPGRPASQRPALPVAPKALPELPLELARREAPAELAQRAEHRADRWDLHLRARVAHRAASRWDLLQGSLRLPEADHPARAVGRVPDHLEPAVHPADFRSDRLRA
jgi:hypothetical protein